ncbi:IucA/IucC family protein [Pararobbsia alpina]|uniref:L-2,3-diaminopropanoate--citrate ligase n=1 Tax=Pararobbsia alpina TaxID=621374 RepID=A0A6S7AUB9_9BURK|nr:IucA/IucC family protein [Pararobbsia alpina]CAB3777341.1 L-2,3-diaminopropanoate--citrate ligase [Pararobbsia alpina]
MPISATQHCPPPRDVGHEHRPTGHPTPATKTPCGDALSALERQLIEQYFNTYCRESTRFDPRVTDDTPLMPALRQAVNTWRATGYEAACVEFPHDGSCLCVALEHYSPMGFHRIGPHAALGRRNGITCVLDGPEPLIERIAQALEARLAPADPDRTARFEALMHNSVGRVRHYHAARCDKPGTPFVEAEQSLHFGHVFHVTSKASEGFDENDLEAYAPELGASFQLHYFAVSNRRLDARTIDDAPLPIDTEAMHAACALLGESEYRLLPCHPWQAAHLLRQPSVGALLAARDLISLGPLGELAWPTSSVRTVWLPRQRRFLKLSLDVRITNFVRNNPPEQVARALDASRYIAGLPLQARRSERFEVLLDFGCMALSTGDAALQASTAVIYREGMRDETGLDARVLASVLEDSVEGISPLRRILHDALGPTPSFEGLAIWWNDYLEVTLLPLLGLFACHGVSLEAHLQNAMVAFRNGWPIRGYVRDMEGASISRARATRVEALAPDSPAFYDDEQAWMRFRYYVLVNHIGHFIACVGRTGLCDEAALWRVTAATWARDTRPAVTDLLADLRRRSTLPAKANMLSCFGGLGETPAWIDIPNPLFHQERNP